MQRASAVLAVVAPKIHPNYKAAFEQGDALLSQYGITTPLRLAHFLAQFLHETGGGTILRESMNYSASRILEVFGVGKHSAGVTPAEAKKLAHNEEALSERVYGKGNPFKAAELGNVNFGDAFRTRGNGIMQTTGLGNHIAMGLLVGVDFGNHPELVTSAEHALKPALAEWKRGNINAMADKNDIGSISRKINGGTNGLADRRNWFKKVWNILGKVEAVSFLPAEEVVAPHLHAIPDEDVRAIQAALNMLGIANPKLDEDGLRGDKTEKAVREYQFLAKIPVDGDTGPTTLASLRQRLSATRSDTPPAEPISKENIVMGAGIVSSLMSAATSGPVQWAVAGIMVAAFVFGAYLFIKKRKALFA